MVDYRIKAGVYSQNNIHWMPISDDVFDIQPIHELSDVLNFDIIFLYKTQFHNERVFFDEIIKEAKSNNIPTVLFDVGYPGIYDYEEFGTDFIITETYHNKQPDNVIGIPLLGALNFKNLINNPDRNLHSSILLSLSSDTFLFRPYNIFLRIGKLIDKIRPYVLYKFVKSEFKNSNHIISLSELSYDRQQLIRKFPFKEINIDDYDTTKLNFSELKSDGTSLHLRSERGLFAHSSNFPLKRHADIFAYAEIMFESLQSFDYFMKQYNQHNLTCFTEKHFALFYTMTIPLTIDNQSNINYLKKLGFKWFDNISPCVIDENLTKSYTSINEWMMKFETVDFKKLWFDDIKKQNYVNGNGSVLFNNFDIMIDILSNEYYKTITNYKLLEKLNHPFLEKYEYDSSVRYIKNKRWL